MFELSGLSLYDLSGLLLPFVLGTTLKGSSLCGLNTYRVDGRTMMELQLPMTSPVRIRFTVSSDEFVWVIFSPTGPGFEEALHVIRK